MDFNQKLTIAFVCVFTLTISGMFVFTHLKKQELEMKGRALEERVENISQSSYGITYIEATHLMEGSRHVVVGEIMLPTPCDILSWVVEQNATQLQEVTLAFEVNRRGTICENSPKASPFAIYFDAPTNAQIDASLDGVPVPLKLSEAPPGTKPEEYTTFIKR